MNKTNNATFIIAEAGRFALGYNDLIFKDENVYIRAYRNYCRLADRKLIIVFGTRKAVEIILKEQEYALLKKWFYSGGLATSM